MMSLGSNGCFVTNASCLNKGHGYGFASNVGHPRSDSVGLPEYNGMHTYLGHQCSITDLSGQCQSCWEGLNILGRPYDITLVISIYIYIYICPLATLIGLCTLPPSQVGRWL
jgi:hypothetical protein